MNTQTYTVNIRTGVVNITRVDVSQGDTGRTLAFSLYDGLIPFTPPNGSTVTIVGRKPSGLGFSETCTVSGNTAAVNTTLAMTQESGKIPVELRIESDTRSIGTANFTMYVEPSPHPDGTTDGTTEEARTVLDQCEAYARAAQEAAEAASGDYTEIRSDVDDLSADVSQLSADLEDLDERLEAIEESGTGSLSVEQITTLSAIVKKITFNGNADNEIDAFNEAFGLISVTGVSLNTTSGSLEVGETLQLVATVLPANALDKSVTWASSNSAIATVSNNGLITAVGIGTFTVTVTTNDGAYAATFNGATSAATVKYPVTYNLSNVTSSNTIAQVTQGDSYTTAISVNTGYILGSISVTMGGTDVTAEVVSGKNISISTITGAIVITATATEDTRTLLYSWDLTNSLVDTVQGATATIASSGASQDSEGLHLTGASGYCALGSVFPADRDATVEVDVASLDYKFSSGHGRLVTVGGSSQSTGGGDGIIYRSTGYWTLYVSSWAGTSAYTGKNDFSGKTLKLTRTSAGKYTLYCDGTEVATVTKNQGSGFTYLTLGTSQGNVFYNAVISAVRIYEGVI